MSESISNPIPGPAQDAAVRVIAAITQAGKREGLSDETMALIAADAAVSEYRRVLRDKLGNGILTFTPYGRPRMVELDDVLETMDQIS